MYYNGTQKYILLIPSQQLQITRSSRLSLSNIFTRLAHTPHISSILYCYIIEFITKFNFLKLISTVSGKLQQSGKERIKGRILYYICTKSYI